MCQDPVIAALRRHGRYRTPPEPPRSMPDRLFGRQDAWFYLKTVSLVMQGARLAKRGRFTTAAWQEASLSMWRRIEACGGRIEADAGPLRQSGPGPVVFVSNHMSLLETFMLPAILLEFTRSIAIVVKESLLRYPLFGHIMRAVRPIGVSRDNPRADLKAVLNQGQEAVREGRSVLVFPQHTRSLTFDPAAFNSLGAKLAARSGVKVAPIAVKTDFMGVGKLVRDFGPVDRRKTLHLQVGPAAAAAGRTRSAHRDVTAFIEERLRSWGAAVQSTRETC